jgi:hypothetical protein
MLPVSITLLAVGGHYQIHQTLQNVHGFGIASQAHKTSLIHEPAELFFVC